jgi:osmoprotectant transport system substrate-binding protein
MSMNDETKGETVKRRHGRYIVLLAIMLLLLPTLVACGSSDNNKEATSTTTKAGTTSTSTAGGSASTPAGSPSAETSGQASPSASESGSATSGNKGDISITIGSKLDVDGQLNAQMYALLLEDKGYKVDTKLGLGQTPVLDQAIKNGDIDIYPEFTGTALSLLELPPTQDAQQAYQSVKDAYEQQFQITWLDPAYDLNDSYAICTSKKVAGDKNLKSLDDLVPIAGDLTIATQQDGVEAAVQPVEKGYNIQFGDTVQISEQLGFGAVENGDADLNVCYTTDPNIIVKDFVMLSDSKGVFPIYNPAPIVRDELLQKAPDIAATLNALQPHLTTDVILGLIKKVSVDHDEIQDVAHDFLVQEGLLTK